MIFQSYKFPWAAALCAGAVLLVSTFSASADVPPIMTYQGKLTFSSGQPVADGTHTLSFAVYAAEAGGIPLWQENGIEVETSGGLFTVILGQTQPLPASGFPAEAWLETKVGAETLTPRVRLSSVAFALKAQTAEEVAAGAAVTSLNSLKGDVTLEAGDNISLTQTGNTITLSGLSIPDPLPVSQSGAWNVGISGTPTVKTLTESNQIQLWQSNETITPGSFVWSSQVDCLGFKEVRVRLATPSIYADPENIRIVVRFQMPNASYAAFGTSNFALAKTQALTGGVFTGPANNAWFIVPVMARYMLIEVVNDRAFNTTISSNSIAYLVN